MNGIFEKFRAMGTDVEIYFFGIEDTIANREIASVKNQIFDFEKKFSRFIKDSELSVMNNSCGVLSVSDEMIDVLEKIKKYNLETKEIFDPTVICALESVGYDKSFDSISSEELVGGDFDMEQHQDEFKKRKKISDIEIDKDNKKIIMESDLRIDLGGIGKGYIIDKIADGLINGGFKNFWFSAGGDIFISGKNGNDGWEIGVQNPKDLENDLTRLKMIDDVMAIATSGTTKRAGVKQGFKWHHIIDPRTGLPAMSDILLVTVVAPSVLEADVFAKTALILGEEDGLEFINNKEGVECLMVDKDLNVLLSSGMKKYLIK